MPLRKSERVPEISERLGIPCLALAHDLGKKWLFYDQNEVYRFAQRSRLLELFSRVLPGC
jgi:hypothetical protein